MSTHILRRLIPSKSFRDHSGLRTIICVPVNLRLRTDEEDGLDNGVN